ncbi:HAD family hydrolase [Lachnoclostridium sp. An14]|uniref:HAD family hydrolase n=1 Tax=Lachnoclostridium sp. An14 TaxID=1965562 RepID=UPI001FA82FF8|nr:HAD family phosphatase [Lachnoclostridium sp. An14]
MTTMDQLREKKAFLFDLDGTLVDSMWMWKAIDIEYLGRFGLACPEDLQKVIEGMSFTETAVYFKERFGLDRPVEAIKQDWVEMSLEKYKNEVPLKEGARRFLSWAKDRGIRMGIATSNGRDMVDAVLDSLDISGYFDQVTTACEVAAGKPAPDIYLKVAEDLGVRPEDCAVFEDVPAGIQAGKAAGMTVVAVDDEFSAHMAEEKNRLADCHIHSFLDLFGTGDQFDDKGEPS